MIRLTAKNIIKCWSNAKIVHPFTKQDDFKSLRCPLPSRYIQIFNFGLLQLSIVWPSDGKTKNSCEL